MQLILGSWRYVWQKFYVFQVRRCQDHQRSPKWCVFSYQVYVHACLKHAYNETWGRPGLVIVAMITHTFIATSPWFQQRSAHSAACTNLTVYNSTITTWGATVCYSPVSVRWHSQMRSSPCSDLCMMLSPLTSVPDGLPSQVISQAVALSSVDQMFLFHCYWTFYRDRLSIPTRPDHRVRFDPG